MAAFHLRLPLIVWLLLMLFGGSAFAGERGLDVAAITAWPQPLTTHVGLLEDPQGNLTLVDVQAPEMAAAFKQDLPPGNGLALGFTRSAFWFRLVLRNSSAAPLERMLVVDNPRVAHIQAYLPDEQGAYQVYVTGSDAPPASKAYDNRNFVFPITLAAQAEQVLYLRVESNIGLLVPLQLWSVPAFHAYERDDYVVQAWYFGIASAMILFNLMLFVVLRDRIYLLYVAFVSCTVAGLAIKNGMAPDLTLAGFPLNSNVAYYSAASIALSALLLFMRRMLQTDRLAPRIDRLLLGMVLLFWLTPVIYAVALPAVSRLAILLYLSTAAVIFSVALVFAIKHQRSAYFFLGAFALLILGGATTALRAMGVLPTNMFTVDGLQLGSSLEMLLLAFALADRYNLMRQDKERMQEQLLQAQQQLVANLQSSERELEQRVAQRTDELQVLNRKLETLSLTDALTGIANRRHFEATLDKEWHRAQRLGEPLALAMLDVDWFKAYNDHYGHPAGDACLQQIARTMAATICRSSDLVARYGGEEFVFLAPMTTLVGAQAMAERLLQAVEALALAHAGSPLQHVTLSIGVTVMQPILEQHSELFLQRADAALYQAKAQGRNRVVCG